VALSTEDWQARLWLADCVEAAGLSLRGTTHAANLGGVLRSGTPGARTLLIGYASGQRAQRPGATTAR
jgi:hypothetical protein